VLMLACRGSLVVTRVFMVFSSLSLDSLRLYQLCNKAMVYAWKSVP
jgi:hypothetical protein